MKNKGSLNRAESICLLSDGVIFTGKLSPVKVLPGKRCAASQSVMRCSSGMVRRARTAGALAHRIKRAIPMSGAQQTRHGAHIFFEPLTAMPHACRAGLAETA